MGEFFVRVIPNFTLLSNISFTTFLFSFVRVIPNFTLLSNLSALIVSVLQVRVIPNFTLLSNHDSNLQLYVIGKSNT